MSNYKCLGGPLDGQYPQPSVLDNTSYFYFTDMKPGKDPHLYVLDVVRTNSGKYYAWVYKENKS
jgi:hypothetical protein